MRLSWEALPCDREMLLLFSGRSRYSRVGYGLCTLALSCKVKQVPESLNTRPKLGKGCIIFIMTMDLHTHWSNYDLPKNKASRLELESDLTYHLIPKSLYLLRIQRTSNGNLKLSLHRKKTAIDLLWLYGGTVQSPWFEINYCMNLLSSYAFLTNMEVHWIRALLKRLWWEIFSWQPIAPFRFQNGSAALWVLS